MFSVSCGTWFECVFATIVILTKLSLWSICAEERFTVLQGALTLESDSRSPAWAVLLPPASSPAPPAPPQEDRHSGHWHSEAQGFTSEKALVVNVRARESSAQHFLDAAWCPPWDLNRVWKLEPAQPLAAPGPLKVMSTLQAARGHSYWVIGFGIHRYLHFKRAFPMFL